MNEEFVQVTISATNEKEANAISDLLVRKRLIAGSLIVNGPSRYWWEGQIVEKIYYNIQAFSLFSKKAEIISEVKSVHSDRCPIVAFVFLDGNAEFLEWIRKSVTSA